jgi:hypothetical protein
MISSLRLLVILSSLLSTIATRTVERRASERNSPERSEYISGLAAVSETSAMDAASTQSCFARRTTQRTQHETFIGATHGIPGQFSAERCRQDWQER